jgi:hypothetical protein
MIAQQEIKQMYLTQATSAFQMDDPEVLQRQDAEYSSHGQDFPIDETEILRRHKSSLQVHRDRLNDILQNQAHTYFLQQVDIAQMALKRLLNIKKRAIRISDDAELQLQRDRFLFEAVERILDRFESKIESENIKADIKLDVFYDTEISDWNTFRIIVNPKGEVRQFETIKELWDALSVAADKVLNDFVQENEDYLASINRIKSNLIISVEPF